MVSFERGTLVDVRALAVCIVHPTPRTPPPNTTTSYFSSSEIPKGQSQSVRPDTLGLSTGRLPQSSGSCHRCLSSLTHTKFMYTHQQAHAHTHTHTHTHKDKHTQRQTHTRTHKAPVTPPPKTPQTFNLSLRLQWYTASDPPHPPDHRYPPGGVSAGRGGTPT